MIHNVLRGIKCYICINKLIKHKMMEKAVRIVIPTLRALGYEVFAWDKTYTEVTDYGKAFELVVNGEYVKLPKRPETLTVEWVLSKLKKGDSSYKNIADKCSAILKGKRLCSVYSTSYGIGVVAFRSHTRLAETLVVIEGLLSGLDYTTEYSDGGLVFRYCISKSKANLEKLSAIK